MNEVDPKKYSSLSFSLLPLFLAHIVSSHVTWTYSLVACSSRFLLLLQRIISKLHIKGSSPFSLVEQEQVWPPFQCLSRPLSLHTHTHTHTLKKTFVLIVTICAISVEHTIESHSWLHFSHLPSSGLLFPFFTTLVHRIAKRWTPPGPGQCLLDCLATGGNLSSDTPTRHSDRVGSRWLCQLVSFYWVLFFLIAKSTHLTHIQTGDYTYKCLRTRKRILRNPLLYLT